MRCQSPFAQHTHLKAPIEAVALGKPLAVCRGLYQRIVGKANALAMPTHKEAIVKAAHVDVWAVLHGALLRQCRMATHQPKCDER